MLVRKRSAKAERVDRKLLLLWVLSAVESVDVDRETSTTWTVETLRVEGAEAEEKRIF